jgi:undecaprenyl-diphosphatase
MILEQVVVGIIQGIAEWLPVSSEGAVLLVKSHWFNTEEGLQALIEDALFLHLGTVLAAIVYFRKEITTYIHALRSWKDAATEDKNVVIFLVTATIISGIVGIGLLQLIVSFEELLTSSTKIIIIGIGVLLLITGTLQFVHPYYSHRSNITLDITDSIVIGVVQGFAVLPGLSRSGLTVAALLIRNYDKENALRLSFLMSIPIVLLGNIVLVARDATFSSDALVGLIVAFGVGLVTIRLFIKVARKVNFGYFVIGFGILTILSAFII